MYGALGRRHCVVSHCTATPASAACAYSIVPAVPTRGGTAKACPQALLAAAQLPPLYIARLFLVQGSQAVAHGSSGTTWYQPGAGDQVVQRRCAQLQACLLCMPEDQHVLAAMHSAALGAMCEVAWVPMCAQVMTSRLRQQQLHGTSDLRWRCAFRQVAVLHLVVCVTASLHLAAGTSAQPCQ
jgi:hypothetical protein